MYLLYLQFHLYNPRFQTLKPLSLTLAPPTPPPVIRRSELKMNHRARPSYGSFYVPPHKRLRPPVVDLKSTATVDIRVSTPEVTGDCENSDNNCVSQSLQAHQQQHKDEKILQPLRDTSRGFEFEFSAEPELSSSEVLAAWKCKLHSLLCDNNKQELVSREKKDRRDFEQIAALASRMGLYSRLYAKVVVVSKVPLPNYRFDLDDKRPQREVGLPLDLQMRVGAYLSNFMSGKSKEMDLFSRSSSSTSIVTDESLFEQPEAFSVSKAASEKFFLRKSVQMQNDQCTWQESPEGKRMMNFRISLPAYKEKDAILSAISQNQVVIISGETGCGKTTQIPQFILESEINAIRGAKCNIICTQPRRISAMSVSERIATERGEKLGETVGYKVRLEGLKGGNTRLLFCTTGILLRRLLVDRSLNGVTHIIVDEIHERGINEDFLLIVLKDLLPRRPELRVILMSATLDAGHFSLYFGGAPIVHIQGFTYPVKAHFLENILETTGYKLTINNQLDDYGAEKAWKLSKHASKKRKSRIASSIEHAVGAADYMQFSARTRESLSCWNPDSLNFNLIEYLLCYICENERPGAVLVFLTGWDDITSLKEKLQSHPVLGDTNRVVLLACHGSMGSAEQKLIFDKPEGGVRKIVLATNIAEISITIDDIVFVVDCGKAKETTYDALNNTSCLLPSWISKSSAKQRRGRAGRVQPGDCYHLYPQCVYDSFADYQLPEILRTPLQSLCLQIKSLKLGSISDFLSKAMQSPECLAVQNAIDYLKMIGALDENENLTLLGNYLAMLPVEPKLGKMLILGSILNCLDPVLTIVSGLSVRDPFLAPMDKKDLADAAKAQFSQDHSDHLALVRAYEGWKIADRDLAGYEYCWKNFLSPQSMKAIDSLRQEFYSSLKDTSLVDDNPNTYNAWSYDMHLLRAIICYGLYPGVSSVVHNEKSFTLKTMEDGPVLLYCNSANARHSTIPFPWLVFNEKIKVNSVFLRDSTGVCDSTLLLFGGSISRGDMDGHLKMMDGYLEFFMDPAIAELYQSLRKELDDLITTKLRNPHMSIHSSYHNLISAIHLLISEDPCSGQFVFNRRILNSCNQKIASSVKAQKPPLMTCNAESGPGGDNPKSQLQTFLTRAGHSTPSYVTKQVKNNLFLSTVEFNGVQIAGQPCNNKKQAEKHAAAEALCWLLGGRGLDRDYINNMSMLLKKSKKVH